MNNEELLNENAKLNAIIDGYQPKIQALKDEKDKYYQQTLDDEIQINELYEENERLKEENYQLLKDCQICENFIDFIPCKPIRDMDYDLQKVISQRDNYYQTLQEIKEIAENAINGEYKTKSSDYSEGMEIIGHYVMQKITKAEEE